MGSKRSNGVQHQKGRPSAGLDYYSRLSLVWERRYGGSLGGGTLPLFRIIYMAHLLCTTLLLFFSFTKTLSHPTSVRVVHRGNEGVPVCSINSSEAGAQMKRDYVGRRKAGRQAARNYTYICVGIHFVEQE
jgi:hypothetical protein